MDVTYRVTLYCIAASWLAAITLDESPALPKDRTKQRKKQAAQSAGADRISARGDHAGLQLGQGFRRH